MVNPITGPFVEDIGRNSTKLWVRRSSYRQAKPFTKRLPFTYEHHRLIFEEKTGTMATYPSATLPTGWEQAGFSSKLSASINIAQAKAFKKFQAKLGDTSQTMVSILERQKSFDMIANRADAIRRGFEDIRRGKPPKGWKRGFLDGPRGAGKKYLEYHFGWEPMVKDIWSAIQVLQSPCPPVLVKASGSSGQQRHSTKAVEWGLQGSHQNDQQDLFRASVQLIADISVQNPLLWRATQLGLTNPAAWAWEMLKLSWLVDWFATVGEFIDGFTAFGGLALGDPMTTTWAEDIHSRWMSGENPMNDAYRLRVHKIFVGRAAGISGPALVLRPFRGLSASRSATSVAYLTQFLKSIR